MKNPSTWIFHLRQGVKFHNRPPVNGREMTAEDVKYSYDLLKDKAQYANRAAMVKNIQVIDKYTLRFELKLPDPKFYLNVVDSLSPVIVPREAVEAPGGLAENPIGTGAFMLKEFVARRGGPPGEEPRLLPEGQGRAAVALRGRRAPGLHQGRVHRDGAVPDQAARHHARLHARSALRADQDRPRSVAVPRALPRLGRLRPGPGRGQGALQRRARAPGPVHGHQPRRDRGGHQSRRCHAVRTVPLGDGRPHQARRLLVRQPGSELPVQPQEGQGAPGRGGIPERARSGDRVGRVPGLDLRRVRAAPGALLRRRGRAREAQAARDVHVARQGGRRAAVHPARSPPPVRSGRGRASWTGCTCATTRRCPAR